MNGDKAHGPGIYDMKAGSFLAFHAVRSILQQGRADAPPDRPAADPGRGGRQPHQPLADRAGGGQAASVLIPEPAGAGGACVTARKGVGRFVLRVEGRGAHAGSQFEDGASAVVELSHQILALHRMVDIERGITLNTAPVWGGSRPNVISPGCRLRDRPAGQLRRGRGAMMEQRLLALTAQTPGCRVTVEGGMNRPPYAENAGDLRAVRPGAGDRRGRSGWRCRSSIAAAGRTAISPRRWAFPRWTGWAAPAPARMPATSTSCGGIWRRGPRCWRGCWRRSAAIEAVVDR